MGRRAVRLRPGHVRRSPAGPPRGGGLAAARPAARTSGDPGLARTAIAPALAREASPPGGESPLRQERATAGPGRGVVGRGLGTGDRSADPAAGRMRRAGPDSAALAEILARVLPQSERYLVKVTWHGYVPGPTRDRSRWTSCSVRARPGGRAGGTYEQPESRRRGYRLGPTPSGTAPGSGSRTSNSCGGRGWRR